MIVATPLCLCVSSRCARSVTVRIDGLKRPFPLPKFKAALEAMSGVKVVDSENFFISMKRTHCYLTMDTVEQVSFSEHLPGDQLCDGLIRALHLGVLCAIRRKRSGITSAA